MIRRLLFVCTGNIFRSLTADVALTRAIMDESHLAVAMSTDHQAAIRERFGREVPLYLEVCGEAAEWLPDIEDVIPDYQTNRVAVEVHVRSTIDRIVELAPRMAENIDVLMKRYGTHRIEENAQ